MGYVDVVGSAYLAHPTSISFIMLGVRFSSLLALVLLAGAAIAAPAESDDARLIQFKDASGALQTEWVSTVALDYLSENRGNIERTADELTGVSSAALDAITSVNRGPGFLDVTGFREEVAPSKRSLTKRAYAAPSPAKYPFLQSTYFGQVDADGLYDIVDTLSNNYTTRAYRSTNARAPALWIQQQFQASLGSSNVQLIENSFNQPNGELFQSSVSGDPNLRVHSLWL